MQFKLKIDAREVTRALAKSQRQIPYATARALTWTAKVAQAALQGSLRGDFTIRNTWTEKGIRIQPAKKDHLEAAVGSIDPYMAAQAEGGERQVGAGGSRAPTSDATSQAVPVAARKGKTRIVPRKQWPGAFVTSKKNGRPVWGKGTFTIVKGGKVQVWQKTEKVKASRGPNKGKMIPKTWSTKNRHQRAPIKLLWVLEKRIKLSKAWKHKAAKVVGETVQREWPVAAASAIGQALSTAR